jgi:hypothetical protein
MWQYLLPIGMSLLQHHEQRRQADADRKLNAELTRYSPWTGMQIDPRAGTRDPNAAKTLSTGILTGAAQSQASEDRNLALEDRKNRQQFQNDMINQRMLYNKQIGQQAGRPQFGPEEAPMMEGTGKWMDMLYGPKYPY